MKRAIHAAVSVRLTPAFLLARQTSGDIFGAVADSSRAVLSGANVTIEHLGDCEGYRIAATTPPIITVVPTAFEHNNPGNFSDHPAITPAFGPGLTDSRRACVFSEQHQYSRSRPSTMQIYCRSSMP